MTEDLDTLLGIEPWKPKPPKAKLVECGQSPPRAHPAREWNNFTSFAFTGYVALVNRCHCTTCDALVDHLQGIFIEEKHLPSGTRRLQQMAPGGDWPAAGGHKKEVTDLEVPFCGECIGGLGFDREVDGKGEAKALVFK